MKPAHAVRSADGIHAYLVGQLTDALRRPGMFGGRPALRMLFDHLLILFRTAGSRYARDGERMQRYFRDAATYWTHVGPGMAEPLFRRVGCDRLGLPSEHIPLIP